MTMFSMAGDTPSRTLSVFYADGDNATIPESHDRFSELVNLLISGASDDAVRDLVHVMLAAGKKLSILSERITYTPSALLFDGDPIDGEIVEAIREAFESDNPESMRPIVNFLEKASTNPSLASVNDLYVWISQGSMTIHEDGDFIAYKGVNLREDGTRWSTSSGVAFVDGVEVKGYIPNADGSVITMPRSKVDDGGYTHCSTGLHAARMGYASTYGNVQLMIKVNPRDVVSVPKDAGFQKMRVCRYTVLGVTDKELTKRVYREPIPEFTEQTTLDVLDNLDTNPWDPREVPEVDADEVAEEVPNDIAVWDLDTTENLPVVADEVVRDPKGRFTKDSAAKAVRNSKGQFVSAKSKK